jgi:acyl carrier protein
VEIQVKTQLREFISSNFLYGDDTRMPGDDDSLLEMGVLDSTGVLELIEFLEEDFAITVSEIETVAENLDSISGLARFVLGKTSDTSVGAPLASGS